MLSCHVTVEYLKRPIDNAAYHKTKPPWTPVASTMSKAALMEYVSKHNLEVAHDPQHKTILRDEYAAAVQEHIKYNVKSMLEIEAEKLGHKVIFTPPYHSDMEPIELVWAQCKGNARRLYKPKYVSYILYM